jgi:hypothetical protein
MGKTNRWGGVGKFKLKKVNNFEVSSGGETEKVSNFFNYYWQMFSLTIEELLSEFFT